MRHGQEHDRKSAAHRRCDRALCFEFRYITKSRGHAMNGQLLAASPRDLLVRVPRRAHGHLHRGIGENRDRSRASRSGDGCCVHETSLHFRTRPLRLALGQALEKYALQVPVPAGQKQKAHFYARAQHKTECCMFPKRGVYLPTPIPPFTPGCTRPTSHVWQLCFSLLNSASKSHPKCYPDHPVMPV